MSNSVGLAGFGVNGEIPTFLSFVPPLPAESKPTPEMLEKYYQEEIRKALEKQNAEKLLKEAEYLQKEEKYDDTTMQMNPPQFNEASNNHQGELRVNKGPHPFINQIGQNNKFGFYQNNPFGFAQKMNIDSNLPHYGVNHQIPIRFPVEFDIYNQGLGFNQFQAPFFNQMGYQGLPISMYMNGPIQNETEANQIPEEMRTRDQQEQKEEKKLSKAEQIALLIEKKKKKKLE